MREGRVGTSLLAEDERKQLLEFISERRREPAFSHSRETWRDAFGTLLESPQLRTVGWLITRRCNFRCTYCVLPHDGSREMTTEQAKGVFDRLADDLDPKKIMVAITGGESTVRDDLVEIVRFLVAKGYRRVAVDSNGYMYGRHPELVDALYDAGVKGPTVSLDGLGPAFATLRQGPADALEMVQKGIEYICTRYPDMGLTTICAASAANLSEIPRVMDWFEQQGIRFARVSPVFPLGRAKADTSWVLDHERYRELCLWIAWQRLRFSRGERKLEIELIDDGWAGPFEGGLLRQNFFYCQAGITMLGLDPGGTVVGCPVIEASFNKQHSALEVPIAEQWRSGFRVFRERDRLYKGICEQCDQWEHCMGGSFHNRDDELNTARCICRDFLDVGDMGTGYI